MDAVTSPPEAGNEPVRTYAPGSPERDELQAELAAQAANPVELTATIGGVQRRASGEPFQVVQPHAHHEFVGTSAQTTHDDAGRAVEAALAAAPAWAAMGFDDRAAIFLRAADLLAGPWRARLNAATMLGQGKTIQQAEIDAACELIDFLRFNVSFAEGIYRMQPQSSPGVWNRMDHRPLDGFVLAITPFNFTAISGNLPTAPAIMGNTVVWKPSPTQQFAAHFVMRVLLEAGLPPGVINMVTGYGEAVSNVALRDADLAGIHFTGSTKTFQHLWRSVGDNITGYHAYPRIVGETGGKDFIVAHPSANPQQLAVAMVRGAYEYQGQKCSALSRTYMPASLWKNGLRDIVVGMTEQLTYGDVTDFSNFGGAVIDDRAFAKHTALFDRIVGDDKATVLTGGSADDAEGYFVQPTLIEATDPTHELFTDEYFGPIHAVYVYDDADFESVVKQASDIAPYALTGALFATDRRAIAWASEELRYAAGNYYINDKPTGAVVNQQPFGGSKGSGTNDKAGSWQNLVRWVSPRSIKENFVPPTDWRYPHQG